MSRGTSGLRLPSGPAVGGSDPSTPAGPALMLPVALAGAVLAGLLLGAINSLSNVFGAPFSPWSLRPEVGVFGLELLGAVVGTAWAWSLVAFGMGWMVRQWWVGCASATLALIVGSVTYYWSDYVFGLNDDLSVHEMAYWAGVALVIGPALGLVGHLARRPTRWSIAPALTVPVLVVMLAYPTGSLDIQPWPERIAWMIAIGFAVGVTLRWALLLRSTAASPSPTPVGTDAATRPRVARGAP